MSIWQGSTRREERPPRSAEGEKHGPDYLWECGPRGLGGQRSCPRHEARPARPGEDCLRQRLESLRRVASALGSALLPPQVAEVVMKEVTAALGAQAAVVFLLEEEGSALELLHTTGYTAEHTRGYERIPLQVPTALTDAVRLQEALWFESAETFSRAYPALAARYRFTQGAWGALPLLLEGRPLGTLAMSFERDRPISQDERTFALTLAELCAQALERARLYHEARQAVAARNDFLGVAGHELKTPLTALRLSLQGLERHAGSSSPENLARWVHTCLRQASRLSHFVDELLDVSRLVAGRLSLAREEVDLTELAEEAVERMRPHLKEVGSSLMLQAPGPVVGWWDRLRLEQVLLNLLTNARKYGQGRPVQVSLSATPERAWLSVKDEGIGIAPRDQARIFERFERAVSERHYGGLGLGLWIVHQVVTLHGGTIHVHSEPGHGSTFTVELPRGGPEGAGRPLLPGTPTPA